MASTQDWGASARHETLVKRLGVLFYHSVVRTPHHLRLRPLSSLGLCAWRSGIRVKGLVYLKALRTRLSL